MNIDWLFTACRWGFAKNGCGTLLRLYVLRKGVVARAHLGYCLERREREMGRGPRSTSRHICIAWGNLNVVDVQFIFGYLDN